MISPETIAKIKALMAEASLFEDDFEESFILGGGPGGQKTNKTSSVVRLVHSPSGIAVRVGESRSRETNRWLARRELAETVLEREHRRKSEARQQAERIRPTFWGRAFPSSSAVRYMVAVRMPPMPATMERLPTDITSCKRPIPAAPMRRER